MSIARSSMIMASGTIVSRVLGFVRAVMLALTIGVTTNAADAFGVASIVVLQWQSAPLDTRRYAQIRSGSSSQGR